MDRQRTRMRQTNKQMDGQTDRQSDNRTDVVKPRWTTLTDIKLSHRQNIDIHSCRQINELHTLKTRFTHVCACKSVCMYERIMTAQHDTS